MPEKNLSTWYIIANPKAGSGLVQDQLEKILGYFMMHQIRFECVQSEYVGHAIELAMEAIQKGFRKIVGIGGDGTNNEIINGICNQKEISSSEITYCLLPIGTGNDWIKEHRIPARPAKWIEMLKAGKVFIQDIGKVSYYKNNQKQERYFANVAGMSYDAFVIKEMKALKRPVKNKLAYLVYGLYYIFKYKIPKARITTNNKVQEDFFYIINAGICRYSGGGMQLVPHAVPDDGKLAITLVGRLSKIGVLLNSWRFYNGQIAGHSKVKTFQADKIKIEGLTKPILIEVDGEFLGETPVEITIKKRTLKIIVP